MRSTHLSRRAITYGLIGIAVAIITVTAISYTTSFKTNAAGTITFQGISDGGAWCVRDLANRQFAYDNKGYISDCNVVKHPRYFSLTAAPSAMTITFRRYAGGGCAWGSAIDFTFSLKTRAPYTTNSAAPLEIDKLLKAATLNSVPDANLQFVEVRPDSKYNYITDMTCIYINMGD